jgi:hypothetical protein
MKARYWNDTDRDGDRKRRRQAEFLVRDFCPWQFIKLIGVCDEQRAVAVRKALLEAKASSTPDVKVKSD